MIKIKTQADLKQLECCSEISLEYYQLVEQYVYQLIEALCPPESGPDQYNLVMVFVPSLAPSGANFTNCLMGPMSIRLLF